MKSLNEFLLEREIKANKVTYNKEKTQELLELVSKRIYKSKDCINLLEQGAEILPKTINALIHTMSQPISLVKNTKEVLLYIKDNYDINPILDNLYEVGSRLKRPIYSSVISNGDTISFESIEFLLDNGFIRNINQRGSNGYTFLKDVVTDIISPTRTINKTIDLILKHGADINDDSFSLEEVCPQIKEHLLAKGRTQK